MTNVRYRVDPGLFSENDHYIQLRRTVRFDPKTLGTNDHHGHLEGSLGYPRPPTLLQNSIGSLRGDVRPDLCQSGLSSIPAGSVWCHSGLFNGKQPKPDPSTVQPDF
ncbi:hypothetical protein CRG98_032492 [Punica granatum]|uniref:Uncharacterized protein n=1 Tax=Punica granatum TaxID=22663 RepID=A0A2I0ITQ6_PUNGR|nr:hypothetical protein CRG98_032492 [Punica granatum]